MQVWVADCGNLRGPGTNPPRIPRDSYIVQAIMCEATIVTPVSDVAASKGLFMYCVE